MLKVKISMSSTRNINSQYVQYQKSHLSMQEVLMNGIIYIVGLIVVVLAVLSLLGLR